MEDKSQSVALMDGIQAFLRYAGFLIGVVVTLAAFVKVRDFAGLVGYVQANGGQIIGAISGIASLAIAAYGIYKTHKRGAQAAPQVLLDRSMKQ